MKTMMITFTNLLVLLSLVGCGNDVKVESFETTMQCFRNHIGIQCLGRGIQCHQPNRARHLTCRVTVVTKDGSRQDMPVNPINNERYGQVVTWE